MVLLCQVHRLFLLHPFHHLFHHLLDHQVPLELPLDQLDHPLQQYHQVPVLLFVHFCQNFLVLQHFHLLLVILLGPWSLEGHAVPGHLVLQGLPSVLVCLAFLVVLVDLVVHLHPWDLHLPLSHSDQKALEVLGVQSHPVTRAHLGFHLDQDYPFFLGLQVSLVVQLVHCHPVLLSVLQHHLHHPDQVLLDHQQGPVALVDRVNPVCHALLLNLGLLLNLSDQQLLVHLPCLPHLGVPVHQEVLQIQYLLLILVVLQGHQVQVVLEHLDLHHFHSFLLHQENLVNPFGQDYPWYPLGLSFQQILDHLLAQVDLWVLLLLFHPGLLVYQADLLILVGLLFHSVHHDLIYQLYQEVLGFPLILEFPEGQVNQFLQGDPVGRLFQEVLSLPFFPVLQGYQLQ